MVRVSDNGHHVGKNVGGKGNVVPTPDGYLLSRDDEGTYYVLYHPPKIHASWYRVVHSNRTRYLAVSWAWRDYGRRLAASYEPSREEQEAEQRLEAERRDDVFRQE